MHHPVKLVKHMQESTLPLLEVNYSMVVEIQIVDSVNIKMEINLHKLSVQITISDGKTMVFFLVLPFSSWLLPMLLIGTFPSRDMVLVSARSLLLLPSHSQRRRVNRRKTKFLFHSFFLHFSPIDYLLRTTSLIFTLLQ